MSNIDALMAEAEKKKASQENKEDQDNRTDYWLTEGIIVKVMNKKVSGGKFYKEKGVVQRVIDRYVGEVRLNSCGTKLRLDQEDLQTVLPRVGGRGVLLNGRCRGRCAEVLRIHEEDFNCDVRVLGSTAGGGNGGGGASEGEKELKGVDYEDISKLAE
jgi:DNA/RNA-binding protein KIN17